MEPGAEFAPNADFSPSNAQPTASPHAQYPIQQAQQQQQGESHWYDRIFDVLLGEDETAPKNRIALVCKQCRLVNGQAPPGLRSLAELGMWRCMACGAENGEMDEGKRIVREVLGDDLAEEGERDEEDEEDEVVEGMEDSPAAGVKKRRNRGKK